MKAKLIFLLMLCVGLKGFAQTDSTAIDTVKTTTNLDALYNRPFVLQADYGKSSTAIGGYLEGNTNYFSTDGVSNGFSMEFRRFNIFLFSTIADRIKFLSELEFEHGTEEINLETALIDFEFHPAVNLRMGIVLPPIGAFNQNHDSPKWEFIDRPLVSTTIIPATLSEVGFGIYGKYPMRSFILTYEGYLVNGLTDNIISNTENRTSLREGKRDELFAEDNNGTPSVTGRIAAKKRKIGELGFSYYGGVYNTFKIDDLTIDKKRRLHVLAIDYNFSIYKLHITGEAVQVNLDVPGSLGQQFGNKQWGIYTDLVYPVIKTRLFNFENLTFNTNMRLERVDYNVGKFRETGDNISDDVFAIVPGVSLRFSPNTLLRANYRYHWTRDILGNPPSKTAGFQFGFASYF
jgi:hypothetical protein